MTLGTNWYTDLGLGMHKMHYLNKVQQDRNSSKTHKKNI
jgi:hypothetical protein